MYYSGIIEHELGVAMAYENGLLGHRCHVTAGSGCLLVEIMACFLHCAGC